jgi:hypothetical protein
MCLTKCTIDIAPWCVCQCFYDDLFVVMRRRLKEMVNMYSERKQAAVWQHLPGRIGKQRREYGPTICAPTPTRCGCITSPLSFNFLYIKFLDSWMLKWSVLLANLWEDEGSAPLLSSILITPYMFLFCWQFRLFLSRQTLTCLYIHTHYPLNPEFYLLTFSWPLYLDCSTYHSWIN